LSALRWLVRPDFFASLVPAGDHGLLLSQMVTLVSRTAVLYAAGYALILLAWSTLGMRPVKNRLMRLVSAREGRQLGADRWKGVIVLFPLLGFVPVILVSHLLPCFSMRYMMVLFPFLLLPMAVAICAMPRRWGFFAAAVLAVAQVYSLASQRPVYDTNKPDYRTALRYLYESGRSLYSVAGTAAWEADNLNKYYSRRFQQPELHLVPLSDVPSLGKVSLLIPDRWPIAGERYAGIQAMVQSSQAKRVRFRGITVYELDQLAP
jgi:hypothetical protein